MNTVRKMKHSLARTLGVEGATEILRGQGSNVRSILPRMCLPTSKVRTPCSFLPHATFLPVAVDFTLSETMAWKFSVGNKVKI
ncbi:hypothetical protein DUNSADRAFT_10954 [Dunaliella salina]|uniref:Encoded protein n=1 Tax=Dunaliella salina TaxID=3046 RepID=A0ABQ7GEG1_DUNSA|nr:hypothetical protein DUNSADRAFT_10954 [Dunaliella salina]|eukprot:KAF5832998.1 hypothetical protein DUNSADRAFT_10954 [Dunaliella salina]